MMQKPIEVFLKLWRWRTTNDGTATDADFALCAEAWEEIRKMEAVIAHSSAEEWLPADAGAISGREPCSPPDAPFFSDGG